MNRKAFAFYESVAFIVMFIAAMVAMRFYIQNGYQGQIVRSGESIALGRQYDTSDTITCAFDDKLNIWYSEACYDVALIQKGCALQGEACANAARVACVKGCERK